MVRVEKVRLSNKSWWASIDSPLPDPNRNIHDFQTTSLHCNVCYKQSKQIYSQGWTCLETSCREYFNFAPEVQDDALDYNEEFMKERTIFNGTALPPLAPRPLSTHDADEMGAFGYELRFKAGIVCPLCKGCSRRIEWRQWTCETPGCTFTHKIRQDTMNVRDAISTDFFAPNREMCSEMFGIRRSQKTMGLYDIHEFVIPGPEKDEVVGVIRHFKANGIINAQPNGPNHLFRQMQEEDYNLKRHPARQKGTTGEVLTSHWAANWGAPYKYGVSVLSKGFDEAPSAIIKALKRLTWAGEQTVTEDLEPFHAFNELLSIGYFEDTAIGYHDDGEKELGPTVATLSLGGNATMSLRPKAKSGLGPGSRNAKGTKLDVLRIKIRHGDIIIMHGSGIQKLFEVCLSL
jgi:2OG-Fe(II) oxygenase superfamily